MTVAAPTTSTFSSVNSPHPTPTSPSLSAATSITSYDMMSASTYSPASDSSTSAVHRRSTTPIRDFSDSEEDEVVWSVSEGEGLLSDSEKSEPSPFAASDDDFVILNRPKPPLNINAKKLTTPVGDRGYGLLTPITASNALLPLEEQMGRMSMDTSTSPASPNASIRASERGKKNIRRPKQKEQQRAEFTALATTFSSEKRRKASKKGKFPKKKGRNPMAAAVTTSYPSPGSSPNVATLSTSATKPSHHVKSEGGRDWFEEMSVVKYTGLGSRPIVDDYSTDAQSVVSYDPSVEAYPTLYEEASTFISSFLSNPDAKNDNVCRLTLLQSLIIELGLATPSLPDTLTAARAFLKSRAFLNIKEYIAVRNQGPEAVQKVLYPSKSALIKDIKKNRNSTSLKWVKQHGLQVLLVGWNR